MSEINKTVFEIEKDGRKFKVDVLRPSHRATQAAELVESQTFCESICPKGGGAPLLTDLLMMAELKRQGIWDDEKESRKQALEKEIAEAERRLPAGKNGYPNRAAAKVAAVRTRKARRELRALLAPRGYYDRHTADGRASQAKFDHLVAHCTVHSDTGEPYFKSVEDYKDKEAGGDPVVPKAQKAMGHFHYGLDDDWEKELPENKFLLRHGLCDEDLWLLDEKGRPTDDSGRLVNAEGRYVDEAGNFVNANGDPVAGPEAYAEFDD